MLTLARASLRSVLAWMPHGDPTYVSHKQCHAGHRVIQDGGRHSTVSRCTATLNGYHNCWVSSEHPSVGEA